jgi:hypothetical protein
MHVRAKLFRDYFRSVSVHAFAGDPGADDQVVLGVFNRDATLAKAPDAFSPAERPESSMHLARGGVQLEFTSQASRLVFTGRNRG